MELHRSISIFYVSRILIGQYYDNMLLVTKHLKTIFIQIEKILAF
jgi:hypothetical protein